MEVIIAVLFSLLAILRIIFGFAMVFFIPGYVLSLLLFPKQEIVDRIVYSIVFSVCIVIIDSVLLNYLWEISLIPILITLTMFTILVVILRYMMPTLKKKYGSLRLKGRRNK